MERGLPLVCMYTPEQKHILADCKQQMEVRDVWTSVSLYLLWAKHVPRNLDALSHSVLGRTPGNITDEKCELVRT